jgi:hypothetical protein
MSERMRSEVSVLVERMFDRADAPALEFRWSYSWPSFTLVFPTAEARSRLMERGTIREFESEIEKTVAALWPHSGGHGGQFDVQKALWVTSS